jgi:transcriptional regulator with XRE-family HTH domain
MLMIGERIRSLREKAGYSQSELAKKLSVTRSSVNAWESGISAPTAVYIIELAKLFRVSTDFILGQDPSHQLNLSGYTDEEVHILYSLLDYFDQNKDVKWTPPPRTNSKTGTKA